MTVKNKTNKNYKRSQKGRSMVEMLGVLAIVGVLSVGGVYGYGVAMKKHKANELLHRASMLASTVSAQAMTNDGKLPETITNFGSTSNGTFETTVGESEDKTQFILTISGLDDGVCEQLQNLQGGMMRKAICNGTTATLSYYKNLAINDEEGKNSPTGGGQDEKCSITQIACGTGCCSAGAECVDNQCVKGELICEENQSMYCQGTDDNGDCYSYGCCDYDNSGDSIIGYPNIEGLCAYEEEPFVYCYAADADGCYVYQTCSKKVTIDFVSWASKTQKDIGGDLCCTQEGEEVICNTAHGDGSCANASCESIGAEDNVIKNFFGEMIAICPKNTVPYVYRLDLDDDYYSYDCCLGTPVSTGDGITSTCDN